MAQANTKDKQALRQENIEQTVSKTDQFFAENKKLLWGILIAVVVVGLAVLGYSKFIYQPACEEAMQQALAAETAFQAGDFQTALEGDGNALGFAQLIDDYGTKAGRSVYMYAGVCALQLGNYEDALAYLKKYNGREPILAARALACEGDAYVGLEDYANAISCYKQAAAKADNVFAAQYLLKEGVALEKTGDASAALKCYEQIKDKYPQSIEGYDIDKYINRVK